jgi:hypothetical protein
VRRDRRLFTDDADLDPRLNEPAIDRALAVLAAFDRSVPVTWFGPKIEPHVDGETMLGIDCDRAPERLALRPAHDEIFRRLDARLAEAAAGAGIGYVSAIAALDFDIRTDLYDCAALYWSDGDHWSPEGEARFGARIAPAIEAARPLPGNGS